MKTFNNPSPTSNNEAVILTLPNLKGKTKQKTSVHQKKNVYYDEYSLPATSKFTTLNAEKVYKHTALTAEDTEDGSSEGKQRRESNTVFGQGKI
eukprot:2785618-Ditylum_brightwellii.AAC.1